METTQITLSLNPDTEVALDRPAFCFWLKIGLMTGEPTGAFTQQVTSKGVLLASVFLIFDIFLKLDICI